MMVGPVQNFDVLYDIQLPYSYKRRDNYYKNYEEALDVDYYECSSVTTDNERFYVLRIDDLSRAREPSKADRRKTIHVFDKEMKLLGRLALRNKATEIKYQDDKLFAFDEYEEKYVVYSMDF